MICKLDEGGAHPEDAAGWDPRVRNAERTSDGRPAWGWDISYLRTGSAPIYGVAEVNALVRMGMPQISKGVWWNVAAYNDKDCINTAGNVVKVRSASALGHYQGLLEDALAYTFALGIIFSDVALLYACRTIYMSRKTRSFHLSCEY